MRNEKKNYVIGNLKIIYAAIVHEKIETPPRKKHNREQTVRESRGSVAKIDNSRPRVPGTLVG